MKFKARLQQILLIKDSPHRIATAFSIGVFIGMSPLLGIHTILGIAIAGIFKLNRLVTLIGVYVTNPWTIVPIYTFGTWFGGRIMGIQHILPNVNWTHITMAEIIKDYRPVIVPFIVGNTLIGFISAIIGYVVIYKSVKRNRG